MSRLKDPIKVLFILFFGIVMSWGVYLQFLPSTKTIWNYDYNIANALIYFFGGLIGLYYSLAYCWPPKLKKGLLFISGGQFSWAIASFLWSYYNIVLRIELPSPSVADYFFLIFILLISVGTLYLLSYSKAKITHENARDTMTIILVTYIATFLFISPPDISSNQNVLQMIFNFMNAVGDAFLFAIALIAMRIGKDILSVPMRYFMIGLFLQALGDFVYGYRVVNGIYWNGDISDLIYTCSGFLVSAAIISLSKRAASKSKEDYCES